MILIKSRKHAVPRHTPASAGGARTAATLLTGLTLALPAAGTDVTAADVYPALLAQAKNLPGIRVEATTNDYRVEKLSSPKFTQPLLDTTRTISVLTRELIQQQAATTLTEALRNSPGVGTFYVGENGNTSTGDSIYMRGFDSSGSIFVDGVRDLGSISRDVFNIEQVEIAKGPAGTDYGRTAPTGSVNLVSKQPQLDNAVSGTIAYGSGRQQRATGDWNQTLGDSAAFRLNVMGQDSGAPGRDAIENNRWGIAPALAFGLKTPTRVYLDFLHVTQENVPDGGVPTIGLPGYSTPDPTRPFIGSAAKVDPSNFYGTSADHDDVDADMFSAIVVHDFSPDMTLHNTTRWGRTHQDYLLTSFRGDAAHILTPDPLDPSSWTIARSLPTFKNQTNRIVTNQSNLTANLATGSVTHNLSAGIELTRETATTVGLGALAGSTWPAADLYHPQRNVTGLVQSRTGAHSRGQTDTQAAYLFDTLTFSRQWHVNAGLRLDHYRTDFASAVVCGSRRGPGCGTLPAGSVVPDVDDSKSGNLLSYKLGVLYKPADNGSLYANFAVSQEPPGGNTLTLSAQDRSADNPNFDPQRARTVELGTKWDLLGERLLVTGAIYRTTVTNDLVQDPVDLQYYQTGRKRVQGIELGMVGKLSDNWAVSAGYTTMDASVLSGNAVADDGSSDLAYTPKSAFTAWTTYHLPFKLTVGGGARYAGGMKRGTDGAVGTPAFTQAYWVFDAMASYPLSRHVNLQLNLYNLFDRDYVAAINKSGYRYTPATPRSVMLTANFDF
ncbi:MAG TPA: catecholate siderophore receptor Fiu [Rhodanobacter sp.]